MVFMGIEVMLNLTRPGRPVKGGKRRPGAVFFIMPSGGVFKNNLTPGLKL